MKKKERPKGAESHTTQLPRRLFDLQSANTRDETTGRAYAGVYSGGLPRARRKEKKARQRTQVALVA